MDSLAFMADEELLKIFHRNKTEMSCMENPQTFLNQLRDHDFVPEERYEKLCRTESGRNQTQGIYEILDWVEKKRSKDIRQFWKCVFKDVVVKLYPTLKMLHKSIVEGSSTQFAHKEVGDTSEGSRLSENEAKRTNSAKKTRKRKHVRDDVQEQPGPSSQAPPTKSQMSTEISFSFPLEKGENGEMWPKLPVICGDQKGTLHGAKLAEGIKCIMVGKQWFTPPEFEKFAGKGNSRKWKQTIQCHGPPLETLIKQGHLKAASYKKASGSANQENDDECWVCKEETGDELVVCDFCPRSFHQNCHLPHVEESQLRDDEKWKCTFCTFEGSHDYRDVDPVDSNSVMSYPMSDYTLVSCTYFILSSVLSLFLLPQECQYLVLSLFGADEKQLFVTDPGLKLENYSSFIMNPMWLRKVAEKLQQKEYQTVGQFVSDVRLIFTNCASYHKSDDDMCAMGEQLQQCFEEQFTIAFNVQE